MRVKTCSKCKKEFKATSEFFHKHKRGKFGFQSWCKVCRNEHNQKWQKANPDKVNAISAKHYARKLNQTPILTESEDKRIKLFYKKREELGSDWHVDHIQPLSKSGLHHPDNMQIVTKTYNLQKGSKLFFRLPNKDEIFEPPPAL